MSRVEILDSTLRDGSQAEGISFSVSDKLKIVKLLDDLKIDYIEAGNPGSNPKDISFFDELKKVKLNTSKLVAFGSTRRHNTLAKDDSNLTAIVNCGVERICIFGKSWDFHVTDIIHTSLDENLEMIRDTVKYLTDQGRKVYFDGEHFFDGYISNKEYALKTLDAAIEGGATKLILCETRGGVLPTLVEKITKDVVNRYPNITIGIHTHNDSGVAVASSLLAYEAGARHIQGTLLGFGERCGNANLVEVICNLKYKLNQDCLEDDVFENLTTIAHQVAELSNVRIPKSAPFIGRSSFAHKGGMHIDGVRKNPISFEHMEPSLIGNTRRLLTSEVAGKALLLEKIEKHYPNFNSKDKRVYALVNELKELEACGYQFEGAEASFDLLIRRHIESEKQYFSLVNYQTIGKEYYDLGIVDTPHTAMIKVNVAGESAITAEEGAGPVNALDKALRKVLEPFYPILKGVYLSDYKVRVLDSLDATASVVRVMIESTDGKKTWNTVGVNHDIIAASWQALSDSIAWYLEDSGIKPAK
ncbi:MAG: citramalate synthase [Sphaerochaetaceae bacterium]|nr:citramalate synthase [Sphaerochaetaceae bacterium]